MNLQFPPFLHEGDKVAIVSPSSKIDSIFLKGAKTRLSSWGLTPVMGEIFRMGNASGQLDRLEACILSCSIYSG